MASQSEARRATASDAQIVSWISLPLADDDGSRVGASGGRGKSIGLREGLVGSEVIVGLELGAELASGDGVEMGKLRHRPQRVHSSVSERADTVGVGLAVGSKLEAEALVG